MQNLSFINFMLVLLSSISVSSSDLRTPGPQAEQSFVHLGAKAHLPGADGSAVTLGRYMQPRQVRGRSAGASLVTLSALSARVFPE